MVVGSAFNLPSMSPRTIAEPVETRICRGKSVSVEAWFFANDPTVEKQCAKNYISLELNTAEKTSSFFILTAPQWSKETIASPAIVAGGILRRGFLELSCIKCIRKTLKSQRDAWS